MMSKLIAEDGGPKRLHRRRILRLLDDTSGPLRIASAYVSDSNLLTSIGRPAYLLTSLSPMDVVSGATSIESLRAIIEAGIEVRVMPDRPRLHAKVYVFGDSRAVVTSANLTLNGLDSNLEVGVEISGKDVTELVTWHKDLWQAAIPLKSDDLSALNSRAKELRKKYVELKRQSYSSLQVARKVTAYVTLTDHPTQAAKLADRYFLCNTDRREGSRTMTGGFLLEEEMHRRGFAAVWETFDYRDHMERVQSGHIILMYAKTVGIIGVGRATSGVKKLAVDDPDRIRRDEWNELEWRIPVEWLAWWDESDAVPYPDNKAPNKSFLDVSDVKYEELRESVMDRFRYA